MFVSSTSASNQGTIHTSSQLKKPTHRSNQILSFLVTLLEKASSSF